MAGTQTVARDLRMVLRELRAMEKAGGLSPSTAAMLKVMIRLAEMLRRQARAL